MVRSRDEIEAWDADLTTAEAAEFAGVKPATIRKWVERGHLAPCGRDRRGWPLYAALDVARAEAATRVWAGRT